MRKEGTAVKKVFAIFLCAAMLLCVSACGKNVKDKAEAFTMTIDELNEALVGRNGSELLEWWGESSSFLSGLYGSIWTYDGRYIVVYMKYPTGEVENVICGELDENGYIS